MPIRVIPARQVAERAAEIARREIRTEPRAEREEMVECFLLMRREHGPGTRHSAIGIRLVRRSLGEGGHSGVDCDQPVRQHPC